jgi:hypothetical protein
MTFGEALKKLNIEDYGERIFNSNSHGELFHLMDYFALAELEHMAWFRAWFIEIVLWAEQHWERPESVFQHIPQLLQDTILGQGDFRE